MNSISYNISDSVNSKSEYSRTNSSKVIPGALFIGILSLYELYIAFLNTMYGEQDVFSKEFFFFFLFLFLVFTTNFFVSLCFFFNKFSTYILILFFVYFFISALLSPSEISSEYLYQLIFYIPVSFFCGFIAFSDFKFRSSKLFSGLTNIKKCASWLTALYIIVSIYISVGFLNTLDSRFIQIATETNIYYQDFGDAYIKATICVLLFQYCYLKAHSNYTKAFSWLLLLVSVQTLIAVVNLILIGSNKGTALIFLTSMFVIYSAKPKNWLFGHYGIKKRLFKLLPVIVLLILFIGYQLTLIDITKTRLFDYGNAGSITENSSFTSRFDQFSRGEGQMLSENIFFGKLTIIYLHSTIASLQTHLGLIGSILLWSFVTLRLVSLYKRNDSLVLLKGITIPILLIGAISSFFTWDLLWFYFGAISTNYRNSINSF